MDAKTSNRQRIVAALAVLNEGGEAAGLMKFASEGDGKECSSIMDAYLGQPDRELSMRQIIKHLISSEQFSSLAEVHPAWILERLRDEPPRVVGIILRFLPSKHVRYLLKNLPPMLCEQIPNMVESFSVPPEILGVIRKRFEKHFMAMRISRSVEKLGFENLYYLKEAELDEMFRDIGLTEMAIALCAMPSKVLHIVYNRLDVKDAKRLQARIRELGGVSPELFGQARSTLLQIEGEGAGPKRMLRMIGLSVFAEAVDARHGDLVRMVQQKMDPRDGYLLKRLVDERRVRKSPVPMEDRQFMILNSVSLLAREGRIDEAWSQFLPADGGYFEGDDLLPRPKGDEETNTAHQLA